MEAKHDTTPVPVPRRGKKGDHAIAHNRGSRRRHGIRHGVGGPHAARFRSGIRTGTTAHFALWKAEATLISTLRRTKTIDLAEAHTDAKTASAYASVFGGGIKNVWDLARTPEPNLLAIKGIGPAAIAHLRRDLKSRGVEFIF